MTDRELLELAAKAAGYILTWKTGHCKGGEFRGAFISDKDDAWNPLTNDGDALRLAVKLRLEIYVCDSGIAVRTPTGVKVLVTSRDNQDEYAATRLAIVRAAAELGKEPK